MTRVLVPLDAHASALSQLLALNTDAQAGTIANYTPDVRHTVTDTKGGTCVVMTQEDVTSLADTLADTLATQHQVSHENGLTFNFASLHDTADKHEGTVDLLVHQHTTTSNDGEPKDEAASSVCQTELLKEVFSKPAGTQSTIPVAAPVQKKTAFKPEERATDDENVN